MDPTPHQLTHPKYRPDIDGLRAIAVISVVGYHILPLRIPGGFIGVDIFFVISGYLISTIIFSDLEKANFNYTEFYARRIKRIFPALLLVLFVSLVFGWYVLLPNELKQLGKHVSAGAGFISNFALWSEAGYFDEIAELKPLLHLWSLGVEEQFYIFWPLLLGLVWHKKVNFLLVVLLVAILSFTFNVYFVGRDPTAVFFSPFSRVWELMVGSILAYIVLHRPQYIPNNKFLLSFLSLSGLVLLGSSIFFFSENTLFPGWWALFPTMGTFFVIAGRPGNWVNRYLLGNPLMVGIGLISYPLYLWHWPLFSFSQILEGDTKSTSNQIFIVVSSFLLAWGTYFLVEKRFKRSYNKSAISKLFLCMVFFLVVGLFVWNGQLSPRNNSKTIEAAVTAFGDWSYPKGLQRRKSGEAIFYVKDGAKTKTLFLGDSHIQQYAPRIVHLLKENPLNNTAVFATPGGCPPIPNVYKSGDVLCAVTRDAAIEYINESDVKNVVIGASWNNYLLGQIKKPVDQVTSRESYYYQEENDKKNFFRGGNGAPLALKKLESFLNTISQTKKVFFVLDNPAGKNFSPKSFFKGSRLTQTYGTLSIKKNQRANYPIEQQQLRDKMKIMAKRTGVIIIDPVLNLCAKQRCMVTTEDGQFIYRDESHFRPFFVEQHANFMDITLQ